jgi:hypothetical protein
MPRLSLYKPERGQDYKFIDRQISEMFQAGGTDIYLHKYLGPKNPTEGTADQPIYDAVKETNIQDLLFLENRDRKYEPEIYKLRTIYAVQQTDWNLSQFGLFIDNDTINITVHINDIVTTIGRKPMSGDVFELPHMKDLFALNDLNFGMPRYYVIEDVTLESGGYSVTWYPHLYRLKCKRIVDAQQFADILNQSAVDADGNPTDQTLRDILSTHNKELEINNAIVQQAEADAAKSGYETRQFYTLAVDPTTGKSILNTADSTDINASTFSATTNALNASSNNGVPVRTGYTGYLVADGEPSNGYDFGFGIQFPESPIKDDFFLRTDFLPNRLFRFDGTRWVKVEDAVRMNMTNNDTRNTLKTGFINNNNYIYNDAVKITYINLTKDTSIIYTHVAWNSSYATAPYIYVKSTTLNAGYKVADYPTQTLISSWIDTDPNSNTYNETLLKITLPVIDSTQQVIPADGQWQVGLYNNREAQRQSLSKVLRPKADL